MKELIFVCHHRIEQLEKKYKHVPVKSLKRRDAKLILETQVPSRRTSMFGQLQPVEEPEKENVLFSLEHLHFELVKK